MGPSHARAYVSKHATSSAVAVVSVAVAAAAAAGCGGGSCTSGESGCCDDRCCSCCAAVEVAATSSNMPEAKFHWAFLARANATKSLQLDSQEAQLRHLPRNEATRDKQGLDCECAPA